MEVEDCPCFLTKIFIFDYKSYLIFSDRLCKVVELSMQYCGKLSDMSQMNPNPQNCILSSTTLHSRSLPLSLCLQHTIF